MPVSAKNKHCNTEIWKTLFSWRTCEAQFNHSLLQKSAHLPWECSRITSAGGCFQQKTFLLADSIFQVFSSKSLNALTGQDKTNFARSFFPAFFCSSAIVKSPVSLLILFSTINSDTSKLDNLLSFLLFLFRSICRPFFCLLFTVLFSFDFLR